MNVRRQVAVSVGAIVAMLLAAGAAYGRLPAAMTVRWDSYGEPVSTMSRALAVIVVPATAAFVTALFAAFPRFAPARARLDRAAPAWTAVWMVVLAQLLFTQLLLLAYNLGVTFNVPTLCSLGDAVMIFVIGNWLGKLRYNFVFGLRTPWTLADELVWDKTHRFAGRLLVFGAVVLAAATFALPAGRGPNLVLYALMIGCAAGPVLAAIVYSALITRPS